MSDKKVTKTQTRGQGILKAEFLHMMTAVKTASKASSVYLEKLTEIVKLELKFNFRKLYYPVMRKTEKGYKALSIKEYCKVHLKCGATLFDNIVTGLQWRYTDNIQDRKFQYLVKPFLKSLSKAKADEHEKNLLEDDVKNVIKFDSLPSEIKDSFEDCEPSEIKDVKTTVYELAGMTLPPVVKPDVYKHLPTGMTTKENPLLVVRWARMTSINPIEHETVGFQYQVSELHDLIRNSQLVLNRHLKIVAKQAAKQGKLKDAHTKKSTVKAKSPLGLVA